MPLAETLGMDALLWPRASPQRDGKRAHSSEHDGVEPLRRAAAPRTEIREARQQRRQRELPLEPGQRRAETEVDAVAEGEVAVLRASELEPVRLAELGRIPVGGVDHEEEAIPPPDV